MITKDEIKELLQSTETYRVECTITDVPSLSQPVPNLSQDEEKVATSDEKVASSAQKVATYKKNRSAEEIAVYILEYCVTWCSIVEKQKEAEA